jgi:8-oxo-dGTP diphosphatase
MAETPLLAITPIADRIDKMEFDMKHKKFVVCVDGVYVRDGKILLLKRDVEPFKGCWHVVGGHVEENESLKAAVKREFMEETGLDVTVGDIIDGRIEETFDRIKIIVAFEVISAEGEIRLNSENEACGWFDEIPCDSVYDYAKYLLNKT